MKKKRKLVRKKTQQCLPEVWTKSSGGGSGTTTWTCGGKGPTAIVNGQPVFDLK